MSSPSVCEKTSEIQKLASLANRLAASRRVPTLSSLAVRGTALQSDPPFLVDYTVLSRGESHVFTVVASSPPALKRNHRLDLTTSRQTAAADEEENNHSVALENDFTRNLVQLQHTASTAVIDDESPNASTSQANRSVLTQQDSNSNNSLSCCQNYSVNVATTGENCTASSAIDAGEVSGLRDAEVEGRLSRNDDNTAADNRKPAAERGYAPARNVSHNCHELGINQTTTLGSSSGKQKTVTQTAGGPVPVSARLIITSPLSNRAYFVENTHRRAMCKPLTAVLPRVDEVDPASGSVQVGDTLQFVASSRLGDQELPVPIIRGDNVDPSNYGRSWYDVVDADRDLSSRSVVAEPRDFTSVAHSATAGLSLGVGDCSSSSSDARSVSSHSSAVSDKSSETSGSSLLRSTARHISETSATNGGQNAAVCINSPDPVLSTDSPRSLRVTATDHVASKPTAVVSVDRAGTKGINLKRLKKSKHRATEQRNRDADPDLNADVQRLFGLGADRSAPVTNFAELATADSRASDWRSSGKEEAESHPIVVSFMSNSLGRHESLQTCNKFVDHFSAAGNIIVNPQLQNGAIQH